MLEYIYIPIILFLYLRTWKYNLLIDDHVPRQDYLWVIDAKAPKDFQNRKRDFLTTFTNIGVFILTCLVIHLLWGWEAAVLYAVLPTNVSGVAWRTGNYYMTTAFLVLVSFFFIRASAGHLEAITGQIDGLSEPLFCVVAGILYIGALESTVSAIPYAFLVSFLHPLGVFMFIPLGMFLLGKRFSHGLRVRKEKHERLGYSAGKTDPRRIFVVCKVIAYYILLNLYPANLGFFHSFGKDEMERGELKKPTRLFYLSLILIIIFGVFALQHSPEGFLWWFLFIGIFSQFITFGQFITERYMFIANIGFCLIVSSFLASYPYLLTILATLWFCRSLEYIPAWKNNRALFAYSMKNFPDAPENYGNFANFYKEEGAYHEAIRMYDTAIKLSNGNKFKLYASVAQCYAMIKKYAEGIKYAELALKNPELDQVNAVIDLKNYCKDKLRG